MVYEDRIHLVIEDGTGCIDRAVEGHKGDAQAGEIIGIYGVGGNSDDALGSGFIGLAGPGHVHWKGLEGSRLQ